MIGPKVVVVGAGAFGKNHVSTFAQLNALRGVVDLNQEILDSVKADYPQATTYSSVDEALADDASSSFVVATPAPYHFDIAKQIISAKRHILVEKPIARTCKAG
jgi:predicted dehydrogenase